MPEHVKTSIEETRALAAAYRLFSGSFREPEPERVDRRDWEEVLAALPSRFHVQIPPALENLNEELRKIFGHNLSPDCPPYETHYEHMGIFRKTQELADLAGFYKAFGLETATGDRRPDHLPVELEFMSLLCLKEALAAERGDAEKAAICREARGKFLGEHLCRWLPTFAQALEQKMPDGYFAAVSSALAAFVRADADSLGVDATAPRPRPATIEEPEDICNSCFGGVDAQA